MKNYLERLLKLSGVQTNENADYDFGHVEPRTHKVKSIASKPGQANLPVRMINRSGDNPLNDSPSDVEGDMEHDLTTESPEMDESEHPIFGKEPQKGTLAHKVWRSKVRHHEQSKLLEPNDDMVDTEHNVQPEVDEDAPVDLDQETDQETDDFHEPTDIEQGHTYTLEIKGQPTPVTIEYDGDRFITFKTIQGGEYFVVTRMEFEDMMIPDEIAEAPFDSYDEEPPQKGLYVDVRNEVWDDAEDFEPQLMSSNKDDKKVKESFSVQYDSHILDESLSLNAATDLGWSFANHIRGMNSQADLRQLKVFANGKEVWNPIDGMIRSTVSEDAAPMGNDITNDMIVALHKVLKRVGISDGMIEAGDVRLTPQGYKKLAHQLTSEQMDDKAAESFCQRAIRMLNHAMANGLTMTEEDDQLDEFVGMGGNDRFSYVTDTLGNVQISDAQTGADVYLQGQDAQEFLGAIEQAGDNEDVKQQVMSQYEHVMDNQKDHDGNDIDLFNR